MAASEVASGTVIGVRYRLDRVLGEGGMGVVWAAEDITTGQRCALKLMKEPGGDPEARSRFLREGRAASAVCHPNVVAILEVLEPEAAPPAIVMELLDGESLRAMLERQRKIPLAELARIMVSVASAVGTAHARGIVHRDLKPENILLARVAGERVVKVLDFGIAKLTALDGEAMRSTGITTGAVLGTPAYMAPEQVFAEKDLDHRADVWALGVILYECLSGVCPTAGDNVGQVLKHVVARPFEPLGQLVPDLPIEVVQLVTCMLARERSQRPPDLREVHDILEPFAGAPGVPFGAPSPGPRAVDEIADIVPLAPPGRARGGDIDPLAQTVREVAPRSRRVRSGVVLGSAAALVLLGAIAVRSRRPASTPLPPPAIVPASPLAALDAKIACPILRASGVEHPSGWLGAAAAAVACERARIILGGRPERMLVPAELLDLSRGPTDTFPDDPYGADDAVDRSVTAARRRAQAYLDGAVSWSPASFAVTLSLRRADGTEIARAEGRGRGLYEAVRSAMIPLVGPGQIPKANELAPEIAAWSRTRNVDDALGVLDLTLAIAQNAGGLPEECRSFDALSARVGALGPQGQWLCAYTLGRRSAKLELDDSDRSAAAIAMRVRYYVHTDTHLEERRARLALVGELFKREVTPRGRSLFAGLEGCLEPDPERGREKILLGVQSDPTNPEGGWCNPWGQLIATERDMTGTDGSVRAMQAWLPFDSIAWSEPARRSRGPDPLVLQSLRRAYTLAPFNTDVARELATRLIQSRDRLEARGIAAQLRGGGALIHDLESTLIDARIDSSMARFGEALEQSRRASEISEEDAGWVLHQRFMAAWQAFELAELLGRDQEVADWLVNRFLDRDDLLGSSAEGVPMRIIAICVRASASRRCFERYRSLLPKFSTITKETNELLIGAEAYVKNDLQGAAASWRPLVAGDTVQLVLPGAMVDAFMRTQRRELAERVDEEVMKRASLFGGATLGHARAARRAFERGENDVARQLANEVINAWSSADEEPPALAEMRRLLEQLRARESPP